MDKAITGVARSGKYRSMLLDLYSVLQSPKWHGKRIMIYGPGGESRALVANMYNRSKLDRPIFRLSCDQINAILDKQFSHIKPRQRYKPHTPDRKYRRRKEAFKAKQP